MSLRKSPRLTPELLAAARRNARHSTGLRSAAAGSHSSISNGGRFMDYARNPSMALADSRDGQGRRHT
jgi:hypothetical protein